MVLIAFEGPSGVGKSTLISIVSDLAGIPAITRDPVVRKFRVEQGHHDIFVLEQMSILRKIPWSKVDVMIDRMPVVSQWVYDKLHGRETEVPYLDLAQIPDGTIFVYLRRQWADADKAAQQNLYDEVFDAVKYHFQVIEVLTDTHKIYECAQIIVNLLGDYVEVRP